MVRKHPVKLMGINQVSGSGVGFFMFVTGFTMFFGTNDNAYGKFELMSELKISFVVSGHGHNGSGTHTAQNIVRYPDRNFLAGAGIYRRETGINSCFFIAFFRLG